MRHTPRSPRPYPTRVTAQSQAVNDGPRGGLAAIAPSVAGAAMPLISAATFVLRGVPNTARRRIPHDINDLRPSGPHG